MLELRGVRIDYGKAEAVKGVDIEVTEGSVTGIVGANGAGKTTILRAISGLVPLTAGEIWLRGERIDGMKTHKILEAGVAHIPEGCRLFGPMTVMQNIELGGYRRKDRGAVAKDMERVCQYFPRLWERRGQRADSLSGGERQMLAIARALVAKPALLLMDEPSLGLSPLMVQNVGSVIREINEQGITVLLVEQNAGLAFKLTQALYVLEVGRVVLAGSTRDIEGNERVRKAFLGA